MIKSRMLMGIGLVIFIGILFIHDVDAQVTTATLSGIVKDEMGAVVPGARVSVRNIETNLTFTTASNDRGIYRLGNLPPGMYELQIEAPGFALYTQTGLELTVGQSATVDVTLHIGAITESITVTSEAPLVEPTKTEVSQIIEGRRITDLPINGRQFIDFALLTPSVAIGRAVTGGALGPLQENVTKISFAGLSEQHSNFFALDGADHNISLSGFQHLMPSQEAVQEFRIVRNIYTGEFGRTLSGVVNVVTKSGTNDFHGSLYYFMRNDALDARNILTAPGLDVLRLHQFGFTLGGALLKDRTFFFTNYEGQRRAQSPIYTEFLLNNLDAINRTKAFYGLSPEVLNVLRIQNYDQALVRVDHSVTAAHRLAVRYLLVDQRNENMPGAPGNFGAPSSFRHSPIRDQSLVAHLISVVTPTLTNDFLFQFSRRRFRFRSVSGEPHFELPNLLALGRNIGPADAYTENRVQLADSSSYQRGDHIFKFGADVNYIQDRILWPLAVNGFFIFSPESFFGLPPFGQPTPFFFIFSIPRSLRGQSIPPRSTDWANVLFPDGRYEEAARIAFNHTTLDVFGQDQWRLANNVTFTFGLRYFVETRGRFDIEEDLNNVQPRVGLVSSFFDKRLVIRSGFGVFHSVLSWANTIAPDESFVGGGETDLSRLLGPQLAEQFKRPDPLGVSMSPPPLPQFSSPAAMNFIREGRYPNGFPLLTHVLNHSVRDFPNPYALNWSLQIEYPLMRELALRVSYTGVRAVKMATFRQANSRIIGRLPNGKNQFSALNPNFGLYHNEFPGNTSIYHGATVTIDKRFAQHFAFNVNYTWSKTIDLVNSGSNLSFKDGPEDSWNLRLNRALSNQHVEHRFVLSFLAEAPPETILRNFKLGTIVTVESPRFYTIFAGFDANGDFETGPDRVGTIGRNTYRGDPFHTIDLRVSRTIRLSERTYMELIAEFFNLFNAVNVTDINTVYGAAEFVGAIPREFGDGVRAPIPGFGSPAATANPRQIQFALRIRW